MEEDTAVETTGIRGGTKYRKKSDANSVLEKGGNIADDAQSNGNNNNNNNNGKKKKNRDDKMYTDAYAKDSLLEILNVIASDKSAEPFHQPVDTKAFKDYLSVVKQPMDLDTIRNKLTQGNSVYVSNPSAFLSDMKLVFDNCQLYNAPGSTIHDTAGKLKEKTEKLYLEKFPEEMFDGKVHSSRKEQKHSNAAATATPSAAGADPGHGHGKLDSDSTESAPPKKKYKIILTSHNSTDNILKPISEATATPAATYNDQRNVLTNILNVIASDKSSEPFHQPVDTKAFKDYLSVVKQPMDLDTIRNKLTQGNSVYVSNPSAFLSDMKLVFDNCQLYNAPGSTIHDTAGKLKEKTEKLFLESFPPQPQTQPQKKKREPKDSNMAASNTLPTMPSLSVIVPGGAGTIGMGVSLATNSPASDAHTAESTNDWNVSFVKKRTSGRGRRPGNAVGKRTSDSQLGLNEFPPILTTVSYAEALKILDTLRADVNSVSEVVRCRAAEAAKKYRMKAYRLPYYSDYYEVVEFGEIVTNTSFHTVDCIYPVGYCSKRILQLRLLPTKNKKVKNEIPKKHEVLNDFYDVIWTSKELYNSFVDIEFVNEVISDNNSNLPLFKVSTSDGILVTCRSHPYESWCDVINNKEKILYALGSKIRRCRGVFNRLCASMDIVPFLEEVQHNKENSAYYRMITAPMWMSEIHRKFKRGLYDSEFDFSHDVRLVFTNCMEFNQEGSPLYNSAKKLLKFFDHLFANWVLNVIDISIDDIAVGPWSDWSYLNYFDLDESKFESNNICRLSGLYPEDVKLLFCETCEDQYHPKALGKENMTVTGKERWKCNRCERDLFLNGDVAKPPRKYSRDFNSGITYLPAPEIGTGWYKIELKPSMSVGRRRKQRDVYLSPYGAEVSSSMESVAKQLEEDAEQLKIKKSQREMEYRECRSKHTSKKKFKQVIKKSESKSPPRPLTDDEQEMGVTPDDDSHTEKNEETYEYDLAAMRASGFRLTEGMLAELKLSDDIRLLWLNPVLESESVDETNTLKGIEPSRSSSTYDGLLLSDNGTDKLAITANTNVANNSAVEEINLSSLSKYGFFGLENNEIKFMIEGMEQSEQCSNYKFYASDYIKNNLIQEIEFEKNKQHSIEEAKERFKDHVFKERYFWTILYEEMNRRVHLRNNILCDNHQKKSPLLNKLVSFQSIYKLTSTEIEKLISLWEFISTVKPLLGDAGLTFNDMLLCVHPPTSDIPTVGNIVFSEVICYLLTLLLCEVRYVSDFRMELDWQAILSMRPLNIFTWPSMAHELLLLMSLGGSKVLSTSPEDLRKMLGTYCTRDVLIQQSLISLLINHPLIDHFVTAFRSDLYPNYNNIIATHMDMTIIKKKYTVGSLVSYSVKEFLEDINLIWSNAMTYFPVLSPIYVAAKHISLWFASVVSRWQLSHLTVKTSTAHRPADASHPVSSVALTNSSVTHPACWYPEFVNLAYSRVRRELPASKNETSSDGSNKNTPNNSDAANNTKKWNVSVEYDVEGLGKYSPPDSKIQSPVTFGHVAIPAVDPYCSCKEINNLQTCFYLLLLQEPDSWTKESRIQFLTTVLNFCTWSHSFRSNMRKMNADIFNNTAADTIPDVGDAPVKRYQNINLEPIPAAKLIKSAPVTCHFTGIDIRYVDMTMQWVVVPDELLQTPTAAGYDWDPSLSDSNSKIKRISASPRNQTDELSSLQGNGASGESTVTSDEVKDSHGMDVEGNPPSSSSIPPDDTKSNTISQSGMRTRGVKIEVFDSRFKYKEKVKDIPEKDKSKPKALLHVVKKLLAAREAAIEEFEKKDVSRDMHHSRLFLAFLLLTLKIFDI